MNILILGASIQNQADRKLYSDLVSLCSPLGKVISPLDTEKSKCTPKERYVTALNNVKWADFVIAEVSRPSTGVGIELAEASLHKKFIIFVAKKGSNVSGLVLGLKSERELYFYEKVSDLVLPIHR
jgi:hypothetical protein